MRTARWLLVATLVGLVAGCSSGGLAAEGGASSTPGSIAPRSTDPTPDAPAVQLPEHLPVRLAPDGTVVGVFEPVAGTMQDGWVLRATYAPEDYEDVAAFYDDHLAAEGLDVSSDLAGPTRHRWSWPVEIDEGVATNSIVLEPENSFYGGNALLTITWSR